MDRKMKRQPFTPGEILREEYLEPTEMTQTGLAKLMKVPVRRVNEIINGKREITPDTALRLEAVFNVSAQFWLNMQNKWDLWKVIQKRSKEYSAIKGMYSNT